jgi:hypothetical protein
MLNTKPEIITAVIETAFKTKGNKFYNQSLLNRLQHIDRVRKERAIAGAKGGQTPSKCLANAKQMLSNIKESKGKESKERSISLKQPSLEEIKEYILAKGYCVDAIKFYSYFTESNWVDSNGKKVKNWKQKIITWDNHSIKQQPTEPKTRTL